MSEHSEHHIVPKKVYYLVFAALMALLFITVAVAYVPLGPFNIYVAMAIAITKATLVVLYFMHVRYGTRLVWAAAGAGFVWLIILLTFTFADYISRGWIKVPGK